MLVVPGLSGRHDSISVNPGSFRRPGTAEA